MTAMFLSQIKALNEKWIKSSKISKKFIKTVDVFQGLRYIKNMSAAEQRNGIGGLAPLGYCQVTGRKVVLFPSTPRVARHVRPSKPGTHGKVSIGLRIQ